MTPTPCPRMFEVEAMRDGRLGAAEQASLVRHMAACAACTREVEAFASLAARLRTGAREEAGSDELHVLRERTRLLAAFDRVLVAPERRRGARRRLLVVPLTLTALAAGLAIFWNARPVEQPPAPASRATVRAEGAALWSKVTNEDKRERVVLERGTLFIHVDHADRVDRAASAARFRVMLPDGELEDTGTTFSVSVEGGQTKRVAVQEGSVLLRIHGRSPIAVGAGETWSAAASAASAPSAALPSSAKLSLPERAAPRPRPSAPLVEESLDRSDEFRAAVAAFDAGDNVEAAATFARFVARHPEDPRAEDATYLRLFALRRCGAEGDMKRAAQEYLTRYPDGFRRAEVERLLR